MHDTYGRQGRASGNVYHESDLWEAVASVAPDVEVEIEMRGLIAAYEASGEGGGDDQVDRIVRGVLGRIGAGELTVPRPAVRRAARDEWAGGDATPLTRRERYWVMGTGAALAASVALTFATVIAQHQGGWCYTAFSLAKAGSPI